MLAASDRRKELVMTKTGLPKPQIELSGSVTLAKASKVKAVYKYA